MATDMYEVLVPELTVMRSVGALTDPTSGEVVGHQQAGKIFLKGSILSADQISPSTLEILENPDDPAYASVSRKLKKVDKAPKDTSDPTLVEPFPGYDEMDEDAVLAVMVNMPSAAIQRIKEYEAANGERVRITSYNIGYGESAVDRQEGVVGSDVQDPDPDKAAGRIKTRVVPDGGLVEPGEGITGTGDPVVPPGTAADEAEDKPTTRRSRRARAAKPAAPASESSE